jgi:alpha-mannosidase
MLTYDHGGLILWGRDHFKERIENAVSWLEKYPGFKIGLDNEAQIYDVFAETDPEMTDFLRGALKKYPGRFALGSCTYGQPLSAFINEESNIRQFEYAIRAGARFGFRPTVYLMSEHAMHSQIPQILLGFGYKAAIMRTHYMMYGTNPTFDAAFGRWMGIDGSAVPCVPTYTGEGAEFGKTPIDNWILTRYPGPECATTPLDFRRQFARIRPLLATRADDSGLRQEGLVREVEGRPEYRWILLEELLNLYPEPVIEFKTLPNDFRTRMPWGYCGNEIWNTSRRAEAQVLTAERLAALNFLKGGPDLETELDRSWQNLLVAQHHDIQICGLLPDARKFLSASLESSGKVLDASLRYTASRMKNEGPVQITVFNPVSWPRGQWIEADIPAMRKGEAGAIEVRRGGGPVPAVLLKADRYSDGSLLDARIGFWADLQGMEVKAFSFAGVQKSDSVRTPVMAIDKGRLSIRTPFAEVMLDPAGGISACREKASGREVFQSGKRSAFFAGCIDGKDVTSNGRWILEPQGDPPLRIIARENGFIGDIPYSFEMIFTSETPRVDCRIQFHFQGQKIGRVTENQREDASPFQHEYKLRFKVYPAAGDSATGVRDLPFAVAETKDPIIEGNYWTALSDGQTGIAFFNRGTMGSVRETDGGFSIPLAYSMYYIWGTRMISGDFAYEFAVVPFTGDWKAADLHRNAIAYNFPAVFLTGKEGDGSWGETVRPIVVDADDVLLSACYVQNAKVLTRLYEAGGCTETARIGIPEGMHLAETDLRGGGGRTVSHAVDFKPWQIRTMTIESGGP